MRLVRIGLLLLAANVLLALPATAQSGRPPGQSAPSGMPGSAQLPPGSIANADNTGFNPRMDRATLKRLRERAYQQMQKDSHSLRQLAAELDRQVNSNEGAERDTQQSAAKDARRIQKLAAEIDRLMRED